MNPAFQQFNRQLIMQHCNYDSKALNRPVHWVINRIQRLVESPDENVEQPHESPGNPYRADGFL